MIESGHSEAMDAACVPLLATSFPWNYLKSITECKKKKVNLMTRQPLIFPSHKEITILFLV